MSGSSPVQQIQDEVTCSICLEPFKDPVILDCGHNYCQACITNYWKASGAGICPQCRQSLPEGELRPNKELKAVADRVKGLDGDCKKHGERFSLFCQEERTLICKVCRESWQHRAHRVLPIEAAAEEFKEQLVRHQNGFQHAREKRERRAAAEERKYQILLEQTEREKKEIVSEFKQVHQILTHGEKLTCNKLEGTKKDLVKARNKNTEGLLRLDNLIDEIRQKCQQQGIEVLQDIDSTLNRYERVKGEEEASAESLTELESRVQALSESQKALRELLQRFRELAPELGFLENVSSEIQRQVSGEDLTEDVADDPKQKDTSVYLLHCEDGKLSSDSCQEQEVVSTDKQNNLTDCLNSRWHDHKCRRCGAWKIAAAVAVLLPVTLITVIALSVAKVCVTPPDCPSACCPEDWIGYHEKCYFFPNDEANWTASQHSCSSHAASLAGFDTLKEKDFLMRQKGYLDAWIGLRREPGQPWKWPNGSVVNLVQIGGGGECAYVFGIAVRSSGCYTKRNWICSKPDEFAKRKNTEALSTQQN